MNAKWFDDFYLIIGDCSLDIFELLDTKALHGLSFHECRDYAETNDNCYIAGMCNYMPNYFLLNSEKENMMYIFLNSMAFGRGYKDYLLIFHECMHLSLNRTNYTEDKEEYIISYAERTCIMITEYIKSIGYEIGGDKKYYGK